MGAVEELQAAEFHERDAAHGELDFERRAVMRGTEQHRLGLERGAGLAVLQHAARDAARLLHLVGDRDEPRPLARCAPGPKVLGEALRRERDHGVGGGKDRLGRTVIAFERHHRGGLAELAGEFENVAHGGGAERIDRLGIVADHGEAASVRLEAHEDRGLQPVSVLVLVDQHVIEPAGDVGRDRQLAHHLRPVD
jgi:hypothetical protein